MGVSFEPNRKGSRNVELNLVPFIDVMSCLAAFLLVTAVWINTASVKNDPAGRTAGRDDNEPHKVAILIESDQIVVSTTPNGEARRVAAFDWTGLEGALRDFKTAGDLPAVEIAAESSNEHPIAYQHLIAAMDTAVKVGYPRVGVTDPRSLAR